MGSKNGKYDFRHESSLPNLKGTIPSYGSKSNKEFQQDTAFIPKCIHQQVLSNSSTTNIENLSLVWLDADVHRRSSHIDTQVKLKNLIDSIQVFDRVDACEKYIKHIGRINNDNTIQKEKLLVIISTILAPTIIPHLHNLPQVKYIYIFGKPKAISKAHQEWLRKYEKIKGIFSSSRSLIAQLSQDQN